MPSTFNVISLGNFAEIDVYEGDTVTDHAYTLVGQTFGSAGNALVNNFQSFSAGSTGANGGTVGAFDVDGWAAYETFSIDGGAEQVFDGAASYSVTITYVDGSTATASVAVFQDANGNTYLAPKNELVNTDEAIASQAALEAGAIRSITIDSVEANDYAGLGELRETFDYVTCFTTGVRISTPSGTKAVEDLREGDLVATKDHGAQAVRWVGCTEVAARGNFVPIRIARGALGLGLPSAELIVSPQHRMLVRSKIVQRIAGVQEVLIPAKKLLDVPGVSYADDMDRVTYFHILLDRHEVIFAEHAPTESLLTGPMALKSFNAETLREILAIFPKLLATITEPARCIPRGHQIRSMIARHRKNAQPLLQV